MSQIFLPSHELLFSELCTLTMSLYLSLARVCLKGRDLIAHVSGSLRRGTGHPAGSQHVAVTLSRTLLASFWPAKRVPLCYDSGRTGTFGLMMGSVEDCVTCRNRENSACIEQSECHLYSHSPQLFRTFLCLLVPWPKPAMDGLLSP